jgi:hypothetical protein
MDKRAHPALMDKLVVQSADTLHGQLQRGLGRGARRAAGTPGAGELVYDCIRRDPRWDLQVESRSLFYARLILDLELPVGPIAEHLAGSDADGTDGWDPEPRRDGLAVEVLADLLRLSRRDAAGPLRRYAEEGAHWYDALHALAEVGDPVLAAGLDEVAATRCDDEDLRWLVIEPDNAVVQDWMRRQPRIAAAVAERRHGGRPRLECTRRPDCSGSSDAELLDQARRRGDSAVAAILELGRRRSPGLLDIAEELLTGERGRYGGAMCRAIRDLGPLALPRARVWAAHRPGCADVGMAVLARHGTEQDVPALLKDLDAAVRERSWGAAAGPIEGLGRLRSGIAVPLLKSTWAETAYSYLRPRLLTALARTAPHSAEAYATEGLWDCEEDVRETAVAGAPPKADNLLRIRRLRGCAAEDPDVRSAAALRL